MQLIDPVFLTVYIHFCTPVAVPCCLWWRGEGRGRGWWAWWWAVECLVLDSFGFSLIASIFSNTSTTSSIEGRFLGSDPRHFRVSWAASHAALDEYWPSTLASIKVFSFLFEDRDGLAQSTKFCCPLGRFVSSARNPVSISSSTTPKPYTSLFTYKWPVEQSCICKSANLFNHLPPDV